MDKRLLILTFLSLFATAVYAHNGEDGNLQHKPDLGFEEKVTSGHAVQATIGCGVIKTSIPNAWTNSDPTSGFDWSVGYSWIAGKQHDSFLGPLQFGTGFLYSGYEKGGREEFIYDDRLFKPDARFTWQYFAPQFITKFVTYSRVWSFQLNVGAGLAVSDYRDVEVISKSKRHNTNAGIGYNVTLGACMNVTKHLDVIASLGLTGGRIDQTFYNRQNPAFAQTAPVKFCHRLSLNIGFSYKF